MEEKKPHEIIIKESNIINFGRKLIKRYYNFLNDTDYFRDYHKKQKNKLEMYLIKFYIEMFENKEGYKNLGYERIIGNENLGYENLGCENLHFENEVRKSKINYNFEIDDEYDNKNEYEKYIKILKNKINDESLNIHLIFRVLKRLELDYFFLLDQEFIYFVVTKHFYIII